MSVNLNEKKIIRLIKFVPIILIFLFSIISTYYLNYNHLVDLEDSKKFIKNAYIKNNKDRIKTNMLTVKNYIDLEFKNSKKNLKKEIKEQVYNIENIIYAIYNKYKEKKSKEEIIEIIKTALKNMRFNKGRGYFFIYDLKANSILQPIMPEREGKNFFYEKDIRGIYRNQEAIKIIKAKKEGFLSWYFHKPNFGKEEFEKIGFIKLFEPYNLIIGTGEYLADFKNDLQNNILNHLANVRYKDDGYIFILDYSGNLILSKNRLLDGINVSNTDIFLAENKNFSKFLKSNQKELLIQYEIKNPKEKRYLKTSILKKINSLEWIIGTGFNLEKANMHIKQQQYKLEKKYREHILFILLLLFIITIIFLFVSFKISKNIERKFLRYKNKLIEKETIRFENIMKELQEIFDNLPMMIIYKDTKNNILRVNKNVADSLGKNINELINVPAKDIFPEDYKNYYKDDLEIIKNKRAKIAYIEGYNSKDGPKIIETSKIPLFDKENNVKSLLVFIIDRSKEEKLKIENEKKQKLLYQQSKFATMGEMIANITHQWKQPLSVITTAATGSKIQKEMDCLSDLQLQSSLNAIIDSSKYLAQTIDDFKNFFNSNRKDYHIFNIITPIEKTIKLIKARYDSQKIEIIQNIEELELKSFENELIQVLINILNNARDELLKCSHLRLIFIKTYKKDDFIFIEIKDNAGGIPKEIKDKIFNSYFTTKTDKEGTGIGLYMSKDIVNKLLEGSILVSNVNFKYQEQEYKGAKFTIKIKNFK